MMGSRGDRSPAKPVGKPWVPAARHVLLGLFLAGSLAACSSGGGGDGGQGGDGPDPGDVIGGGGDASVAFSYPVNGQDDVYVKSQIAVAYRGDVDGDPGLTLAIDGEPVDTDVERDSDQSNIFRLSAAGEGGVERAGLEPNANYSVVNADGDTLFSFTTRGYDGRPGAGDFSVAQLTRIGDRNVPFTAFNPIRARFTSPVDEGSVELCEANETLGNDCTVAVSGPDGAVPGRLTILGSDMTFDPSSDLGDGTPNSRNAADYDSSDLVGGQTYTVAFDGVRSAFGDELATRFDVTPVAISEGDSVDTVQALTITGGSGDSPLDGGARNLVNISSQLIGSNDQPASNADDRGGILTRLAGTTSGSRYNNTFPGLIPAGQQFDLTPLALKLNGEVDTPVDTDNIRVRFINDADVYLASNAPLAGLEDPTKVLLRFDLGISTDVPQDDPIAALSNGVFNQTAMNIVAAGLAVPQENGDIKLTTLGSFPVSVNRTGNAIVDFELELTLPNPSASDTVTVGADSTPPRIIAQYPSACLYTFNTQGFLSLDAVADIAGTTTLSAKESRCEEVSAASSMGQPKAINSFPLTGRPSILFSEPVDPISLVGNIDLMANGASVESRLRAEGASVVIDPVEPLEPDTEYTVTVSNGVADLSGNGLSGAASDFAFTTAPLVVGNDDIVVETAPFIGSISVGLPCALQGGNFADGGDMAGRCVGDKPEPEPTVYDIPLPDADPVVANASPSLTYPVFENPANVDLDIYFSKYVQSDSIDLADGCLIGGNGSQNSNSSATVALQRVDANGACEGVVDGRIALLSQKGSLTRGFSFRPEGHFEPGERYWLVICGSTDSANNVGASSCSGTQSAITGEAGYALNTNPVRSTGNKGASYSQAGTIGTVQLRDDRGEGGPDLIMPFDAVEPTTDFYATTRALPATDTNGNGFFDSSMSPSITDNDDNARETPQAFDDSLGEEKAQPANEVELVYGANGQFGPGTQFPTPPQKAYLSLGRPVAIRSLGPDEDCSAVTQVVQQNGTPDDPSDDQPIVSEVPDSCIPVSLLPGGITAITSTAGLGILSSGRILLRYPNERAEDDPLVAGDPQQGYIVPRCEGTFTYPADSADPNGDTVSEEYDYQPCFVGNLTLTVNGPALSNFGEGQPGIEPVDVLKQQDINVQVFGPVGFEQNGRLVISTRNTNQFQISAALPFGPSTLVSPARVYPGKQALQLVGPAIHGGLSFPVR